MKEPIIINESKVLDRSGDITFFKTVTKAERYIEPIDVENGEYFAFDAQGRLLSLSVVGNAVVITDRNPVENCHDILEKIMTEYLSRLDIPVEDFRRLSFSILLQKIEKYCTII